MEIIGYIKDISWIEILVMYLNPISICMINKEIYIKIIDDLLLKKYKYII